VVKAFFTLETTGLDILNDDVIRITLEIYDNITIIDSLDVYIKSDLVNDETTKYTGISKSFLDANGEYSRDVIIEFTRVINKYAPQVAIGHGLLFYHYPILVNWMYRKMIGTSFKLPRFRCIMDLQPVAMDTFPNIISYTLINIADACSVDMPIPVDSRDKIRCIRECYNVINKRRHDVSV